MLIPVVAQNIPASCTVIPIFFNKSYFRFSLAPNLIFYARKTQLAIRLDPNGVPVDPVAYSQQMCNKAKAFIDVDIVSRC